MGTTEQTPTTRWTVDIGAYGIRWNDLDGERAFLLRHEIGSERAFDDLVRIIRAAAVNGEHPTLPTAEQVGDRANITYRDAEAALEAIAHFLGWGGAS